MFTFSSRGEPDKEILYFVFSTPGNASIVFFFLKMFLFLCFCLLNTWHRQYWQSNFEKIIIGTVPRQNTTYTMDELKEKFKLTRLMNWIKGLRFWFKNCTTCVVDSITWLHIVSIHKFKFLVFKFKFYFEKLHRPCIWQRCLAPYCFQVKSLSLKCKFQV